MGSKDHVLSELDWLSECDWLLVNSPKDHIVFESIVESASRSGTQVCLVLTQSPNPFFIREHLLPDVHAVICSYDEVPGVMNWDVDLSVTGATRLLANLQKCAPRAMIFVTMGELGVLAAEPGTQPFWVRMNEGAARSAQVQVAIDPTHLCGVGDAFAGGVAAYLSCGQSLLGASSRCIEPLMNQAAAAGTAVAARWFGFDRELTPYDLVASLVSRDEEMACCS